MDQDYLLIGVDPDQKVSIRLLSMSQVLADSEQIHSDLPENLRVIYRDFVLGSVILGSRLDDQESILYKLRLGEANIQINVEVNPGGLLRTAIFPSENLPDFSGDFSAVLQVVRLKRNNEVYQSVTQVHKSNVLGVLRGHLAQSDQTESLLFLQSGEGGQNFALWVERLPGTSDEDWAFWRNRFKDDTFFASAFSKTNDPDQIVQNLFPEKMRILAVTKPKLSCSCTEDKIFSALQFLSEDDLVEIFTEGEGVEIRCDYCGKLWRVEDEKIRDLVKGSSTIH